MPRFSIVGVRHKHTTETCHFYWTADTEEEAREAFRQAGHPRAKGEPFTPLSDYPLDWHYVDHKSDPPAILQIAAIPEPA